MLSWLGEGAGLGELGVSGADRDMVACLSCVRCTEWDGCTAGDSQRASKESGARERRA